MRDNLSAVKIKVIDDSTGEYAWVHMCYVGTDVYLRFLKTLDCSRKEVADYVCKWLKQDFNYKTTMTHSNDILILKSLVRDFYKKAYPSLFLDTGKSDRQGWLRVWVTKKMEEELEKYE